MEPFVPLHDTVHLSDFYILQLQELLYCYLLPRFALGLVFYGISFGIQSLAGNIYLNLFLFSVVGVPGKIITVYLTNR